MRRTRDTEEQLLKPTPVDYQLSQSISAALQAQRGQCFNNALRALSLCPSLEGGLYVEGWAVTASRVIIDHGWVELDGKVVDPTLPDQGILLAYFPAQRFTLLQARAAVYLQGGLPLLTRSRRTVRLRQVRRAKLSAWSWIYANWQNVGGCRQFGANRN